jgi:hypothetical protein
MEMVYAKGIPKSLDIGFVDLVYTCEGAAEH